MTSAPIDTDRWPGLHVAPSGPKARVAASIARKIFQVATARLGIAVIVPNRDDWSVDLDSAAVRGPAPTRRRSCCTGPTRSSAGSAMTA